MTDTGFEFEPEVGKLAAKAYSATTNRDAAIQLMVNNSALTRNEALMLWEAIDAYVDLYQK